MIGCYKSCDQCFDKSETIIPEYYCFPVVRLVLGESFSTEALSLSLFFLPAVSLQKTYELLDLLFLFLVTLD